LRFHGLEDKRKEQQTIHPLPIRVTKESVSLLESLETLPPGGKLLIQTNFFADLVLNGSTQRINKKPNPAAGIRFTQKFAFNLQILTAVEVRASEDDSNSKFRFV